MLTPTSLAAIQSTAPSWLWHSRIPRAKVTILLGPPDSGKSFLALNLALSVASGRPLAQSPSPPVTQSDSPPSVLYLPDHTAAESLAQRAPAALSPDANAASRFHILLPHIKPVAPFPESVLREFPAAAHGTILDDASNATRFLLNSDGFQQLDSAILAHQPASLLVIDALLSFVHTGPFTRAGRARAAGRAGPLRLYLESLTTLAARYNLAVLAIARLPARSGASVAAAAEAARSWISRLTCIPSALLVTPDPAAPTRRLLIPIRSSLCQRPPALAFTIHDGHLTWEPDPADSPDRPIELAARQTSLHPDATDTQQWLRSLLSRGPARATEVARLARRDGLPYRNVQRAKQRLSIISQRRGVTHAHWEWSLPPTPTATSEERHTAP